MRYFCLFFFLFFCVSVMGQNKSVVIKKIRVEGLKKTRERVVLRQLDFRVGDSLEMDNLTPRFERNQQYLLNTRLFLKAEMNVGEWVQDSVEIVINLKENWYLYPLPFVEYADRNFNAWWVEQNHAFNRLNVGAVLYHENFTGNADPLQVEVQFGYEQEFEVEYTHPFMGEKQQFGTSFNVQYARRRETPYATIRDSLYFYESDSEYTLQQFNAMASVLFQPDLFQKQTLSLGFYNYNIADTIATLNPDFLLDGKTQQAYFSLSYEYDYDKRNIRTYATDGWRLLAWAQKDGLGLVGNVNNLFVNVAFANYHSFGEKWSLEMLSRLHKSLIQKNSPYYQLRRAIGYEENYIRGYEYYVIDGQDFGYLKNSMRYAIFDGEIDATRYIPIKRMKAMPLKIYSKTHLDIGYVADPFEASTSLLANDWLLGVGAGVDFVLYHNFVFQLEYSFNHLLEKGVYLHFNLGF